jgi:hypothetical protein
VTWALNRDGINDDGDEEGTPETVGTSSSASPTRSVVFSDGVYAELDIQRPVRQRESQSDVPVRNPRLEHKRVRTQAQSSENRSC